jgi:hypothetical protein
MSKDTDLNKFVKAVEAYDKHHKKQLEGGKQERDLKKNMVTALKDLITNNQLPYGVAVQVRDCVYKYTTSDSEKIVPEKWLELYDKKRISRKQFLEAITVNKDAAKRSAGADLVDRILEIVKGTTMDMRVDKVKTGDKNEIKLILPLRKLIKKRRGNAETEITLPKRKILINVRN